MMTQLRNLPPLVGIALIWGILWAALAMIAGTIIAVIDPTQIDPGEAPIVLAPAIGLVGLLCGLGFAVLVSIRGRTEAIFDVPLARVVLWGMVVAALVPLLTGKVIPEVLVIAPVGGVSAMVSMAIVRKWTMRPSHKTIKTTT